jgi:adenylate cyclase
MVEERAKRRLAAILVADVVGYSRLIAHDETGTLAVLKDRRRNVLNPLVARHGGRIVKVMGDGVLVEFTSAVSAVHCAVELQKQMAMADQARPVSSQIILRVGINLGDVVVEEGDIFGEGVIIAARLEAMSEPGGIYVSGSVYDQVRNKVDFTFEDIGRQPVKNVPEPVQIYRVDLDSLARQGGIRPQPESSPSPDKPSVAVLPFANMSGDPQQQYFTDGITEDIITALSRFPDLSIIAHHSSFQYREKSVDVRRIGRELGVRYVVEGSLRKVGSRVRIAAQFVEAASGNHLWAERYDRDLNDVFTVLDEVTQSIVISLFGRLVAASANKGNRKPTEQWNAYDLLLQARECMQRFDLVAAEALTQRAIQIDPKFARAHATQAKIHLDRYFDDCQAETLRQALACAQKALTFDETDGFCQSIIGMVSLFMHDFDLANSYFEKALAANPNNISFVSCRAMGLARIGRSREALALLDIVAQRDPLRHGYYWASRCIPLLQERRYEEVVDTLSQVGQKPAWIHGYLAVAYAHLGRDREAHAAVAEVLRLQPDTTISKYSQADPWKNRADLEHLVDGWRRAGLPE